MNVRPPSWLSVMNAGHEARSPPPATYPTHGVGAVVGVADRPPQLLSRELAEQADLAIIMGCGDQCPYIPGKRYLDWELPDPRARPIDEVRATVTRSPTESNG